MAQETTYKSGIWLLPALLTATLLLASCEEEEYDYYIYEEAPRALIFFVDADMADSVTATIEGYNAKRYDSHINLFDGNYYHAFYDPHTGWGLGSGYDENAALKRIEYMDNLPGYQLTLDVAYEDNYMDCYFDRDTLEFMLRVHYTVYIEYSETDEDGEPYGDETYSVESPHVDNMSDYKRTYVTYDICNEKYAFVVYVFL